MDRDKKDSNLAGLKAELKQFEIEMEKLEHSLVHNNNSLVLEEKVAGNKELDDRLDKLRREVRGKELKRQFERDAVKRAEG
ncbi:MAG: hypothetical protein ACFE9R_21325 [Candidatus Hermodarchaeota archaeon]